MTVSPSILTLRPEQVAQHPDNLRDPSRDISALAASIQEVGVLVPLIVVPVTTIPGNWDGAITHLAIDGNRRQRAAAQVGVDLPCIVRDDLATARDTAVTMTVTALARDGWTIREEINGVQTLLDLGLSQTVTSQASGRKTTHVRAAKKAATLSAETTETAVAYDLTLDQMAILADWADDDEAVAALLDAAQHGRIDHVVARLERDRRASQAVDAAIAAHTAAGTTITADRPGQYGAPYRLDALTDPHGTTLTTDSHNDCPGRAVWVGSTYYGEVVEMHCCAQDLDATTHQARYSQQAFQTPPSGPMNDEQKAQRRGTDPPEQGNARGPRRAPEFRADATDRKEAWQDRRRVGAGPVGHP